MPVNKKPNKHKSSGIDPKTRAYLEARMRKENIDARVAGKEYGTLAMGIISLMATIACSEVTEIRKYIIDASEVLADNDYIGLKELISKTNEKMGSSVTTDQIVEVDPALGQFF
jgi:hypothetical protein